MQSKKLKREENHCTH